MWQLISTHRTWQAFSHSSRPLLIRLISVDRPTAAKFVDAGPPDRMQQYRELGIRVFEFRYEFGLVRVEDEMGDTTEDEGDDSP